MFRVSLNLLLSNTLSQDMKAVNIPIVLSDHSPVLLNRMQKSDYYSLQFQKPEFVIHPTKSNYFCNGEPPIKHLALRLKHNEAMFTMTAVKKDNVFVTKTERINNVFKDYYCT